MPFCPNLEAACAAVGVPAQANRSRTRNRARQKEAALREIEFVARLTDKELHL